MHNYIKKLNEAEVTLKIAYLNNYFKRNQIKEGFGSHS